MNRTHRPNTNFMAAAVLVILIIVLVISNAQYQAKIQRSEEIRQCQDRCVKAWGDGPVVKLADCLVECNPEDYP